MFILKFHHEKRHSSSKFDTNYMWQSDFNTKINDNDVEKECSSTVEATYLIYLLWLKKTIQFKSKDL